MCPISNYDLIDQAKLSLRWKPVGFQLMPVSRYAKADIGGTTAAIIRVRATRLRTTDDSDVLI